MHQYPTGAKYYQTLFEGYGGTTKCRNRESATHARFRTPFPLPSPPPLATAPQDAPFPFLPRAAEEISLNDEQRLKLEALHRTSDALCKRVGIPTSKPPAPAPK